MTNGNSQIMESAIQWGEEPSQTQTTHNSNFPIQAPNTSLLLCFI
jgi:hypothetical protein